MSETTKKAFDAVEMMRSAREKISSVIAGMTPDEQNHWLHEEDLSDETLRRLMETAAQDAATSAGARQRAPGRQTESA